MPRVERPKRIGDTRETNGITFVGVRGPAGLKWKREKGQKVPKKGTSGSTKEKVPRPKKKGEIRVTNGKTFVAVDGSTGLKWKRQKSMDNELAGKFRSGAHRKNFTISADAVKDLVKIAKEKGKKEAYEDLALSTRFDSIHNRNRIIGEDIEQADRFHLFPNKGRKFVKHIPKKRSNLDTLSEDNIDLSAVVQAFG